MRFRRHLDEDEGVKEMRFDAGRREVGRVGFEKDDADDIVADVPFSLQLINQNASPPYSGDDITFTEEYLTFWGSFFS